jgi:serine/threonine protein kinase
MHHANISGEIVRNRYQIIDVLGKGGVGITYGAIDLQTQERVAIKAVSLKLEANRTTRTRGKSFSATKSFCHS